MNTKRRLEVIASLFMILILASSYIGSDFGANITSAATCPSPLLGYNSDSYVSYQKSSWKTIGYVGRSLAEVQYGYNHIVESPIRLNVTANSLPSGFSIKEKFNDYQSIADTWLYTLEGVPSAVGNYTIVFTASAADMSCGSDVGTMNLSVQEGQIYCSLKYTSPVYMGKSATISWEVKSDAGITSGNMVPSLAGSADFTRNGSGQTQPLSQQTTFTLNLSGPAGGSGSCNITINPSAESNLVTFVKSVFQKPVLDSAGSGQTIDEVIVWDDKFVYSGNAYLINPYGGLWVVNQDGTNLISREPHMDADAEYRSIAQHGLAKANGIWADWAEGGGFLRENSSWASCRNNCDITGAGANKSVHYSWDGSDVYISGKNDTINSGFIVLKGKAIAKSGKLLSLPDLSVVKSVYLPPSLDYGMGFYDFVIDRGGAVAWKYSESGGFSKVKDLVSRPSGAHSLTVRYAFDFSTNPAKLVVYSHHNFGGLWMNQLGKIIRVYKISGDTLVLEKEYKFDDCNVMPGTTSITNPCSFKVNNGFAAWNNYFIFGNSTGFDAWKGSGSTLEKVAEVELPAGPKDIVINENGYISTIFSLSMDSQIYKINANAPTSPTTPTTPGGPGGGGTGPVSGSLACYQKYPTNIQLRDLCEQIEALKKQVCKLAPTLSFCATLSGGTGGGGGGGGVLNQAP